MRKIFNTVIFTIALVATASAHPMSDKLRISNPGVNVDDDDVMSVSFCISVAPRAIKANSQLVLLPVITNGEHKVSFSPIIIQGHRARANMQRYDLAEGVPASCGNPVYLNNGDAVTYSSLAPVQLWMQGADLIIEAELSGCCSKEEYVSKALVSDVYLPLYKTVYVQDEEVLTPEVVAAPAVEKNLSFLEVFPFVMPVSEYDPQCVKVVSGSRGDDTSLSIYFRQGRTDIDYGYLDNSKTLHDLIDAINVMQASDDVAIKYVVVTGFASPEGSAEVNDRIAFARALAVRDYIIQTTAIPEGVVRAFNGSVDWQGLRDMVSNSDMADKREVLDIIDNVPIWDSKRQVGRRGELMRLNGGNTYKYMYREFFPKMRNGASIRIYYEER